MSIDYASGLSPYEHKGRFIDKEVCFQFGVYSKFYSILFQFVDNDEVFASKLSQLVDYVKKAKYVVLVVGAGLSTSAGIPDFR